MTIQNARLAVPDEPVALNGAGWGDLIRGMYGLVVNTGAVDVELGGPDVAFGEGVPLAPGGSLPWESRTETDVLYAVADVGQAGEVAVLRGGV